MKKIIKGLSLLTFVVLLQSCGETSLPDPNPGGYDGLDFTVNINDNPYRPLQNVGGYAIATSQKVIIARLATSTWTALSSTCPNDASATMQFNSKNNTFSCGSATFDANGKGSSGNLKKYNTTFSNNSGILRIFE